MTRILILSIQCVKQDLNSASLRSVMVRTESKCLNLDQRSDKRSITVIFVLLTIKLMTTIIKLWNILFLNIDISIMYYSIIIFMIIL